MRRRTVSTITKYEEPKQIFKRITSKTWPYVPTNEKPCYVSRDRAFMAMSFGSAGRVTAILGGPRYLIQNSCLECKGAVEKVRTSDGYWWICEDCGKNYGSRKPDAIGDLVKIGRHDGILLKNLILDENAITITEMKVVKRKQKTIQKHGMNITVRDDFLFPLTEGLYESDFGDQLVPFSWLIKEYIERFMKDAEPDSRLFGFGRGRGWQIIQKITGMFPNWFRAQAEHFYGHYLIQDSVRLSKFVKVVNPYQVAHYIGFSYEALLKDKRRHMDFDWIDPAVEEIKERIENGGEDI